MFEYKGFEITNVDILPSKYGDCSIYHLVAKKDIEIGGMHRKRGQKFCGRVMRRGLHKDDYTIEHFQQFGCTICKKWLDRMVEAQKQKDDDQKALEVINVVGSNKQTNKELITAWKNTLRVLNYSDQSVKKYSEYATLFVRFINKPLIEVTGIDLYSFFVKETKSGKPKSTSTKNTQKFALMDFYKFLLDNGTISKTPFESKIVFRFSGKQHKKLPLRKKELDIVDKYFKNKSDPRDYVLFNILLGTGGRKSEILNMRLKDLYPDDSSGKKVYWAIVFNKGAKERPIPLKPELTEVIDRYIAMKQITNPEEYLFTSKKGEKLNDRYLNQIFTQIAKETGINHFSPHTLRITYTIKQKINDFNS